MSDYRIIYTDNTTPALGEPEPIKSPSKAQQVLRWSVALLFVLAMVYLYGAQQFVQFHRTPTDTPAGEYESLIDGELIEIPATVFVLSKNDEIDSMQMEALIERSNSILGQASVAVMVDSIELVSVPQDQPVGPQLVNDPDTLEGLLPELADNRLHIVVVEALGGINGVAFSGRRMVAVAEYTTGFDFRVLAHEVGHALTLGHVDDRGNLMYSGSSGTTLTKEQAREAYEAATSYLPDES